MNLEQRILDALNEQPATKVELCDVLNAKQGSVEAALRRLARAKEIEPVPAKRGLSLTYRALTTKTSIVHRRDYQSVTPSQPYIPGVSPLPDFIRAMREGREA